MAAGPDPDAYVKMASEYSEIQEMAAKIRALRAAEQERADLDAMLADRATDAEMKALAEADLPAVERRIEDLHSDIQILLLPRDAADSKNAILEIRAGTGGDEAAPLPAIRMYARLAQPLRAAVRNASAKGGGGGFKEVIATVSGRAFCQAETNRVSTASSAFRKRRRGRIHIRQRSPLPEAEEVDTTSARGHPHRHDARRRRRQTSTPPTWRSHHTCDRHHRRRRRSRNTKTAPAPCRSCGRLFDLSA
jgi:peptide chain release factor 1